MARIPKNQYHSYIKSAAWKNKRHLFLRPGCEICGLNIHLQLHHMTYKTLGEERPEDLATLCRDCHHACHTGSTLNRHISKPPRWFTKMIKAFREGRSTSKARVMRIMKKRWMIMFGETKLPSNYYFSTLAVRVSRKGYIFPKNLDIFLRLQHDSYFKERLPSLCQAKKITNY